MANNYNDRCVFCKIAHKERYADIIDDKNPRFLTILDYKPQAEIHTLAMPRAHFDSVWDMTERDFTDFMLYCRNIIKALQKSTGNKTVFTFVYGIHVKHAHMHIIPYDLRFIAKYNKFNESFRIVDNKTPSSTLAQRLRIP